MLLRIVGPVHGAPKISWNDCWSHVDSQNLVFLCVFLLSSRVLFLALVYVVWPDFLAQVSFCYWVARQGRTRNPYGKNQYILLIF